MSSNARDAGTKPMPLRDFTDAEKARLDAIEAAPAAEESVRERVARALWEANNPALAAIYTPDKVTELWAGSRGTPGGDRYREQADAAIDVLRGPSSDAEQAFERVLDLADEWERLGAVRDFGLSYWIAADRLRSVVGEAGRG